MSRIHPSKKGYHHLLLKNKLEDDTHPQSSFLTVWKRSSMTFQGTDGFTVFDQYGRLAFRVDNYSRKCICNSREGLILMNGEGNALLTLKPPKVWSKQYEWTAYRGEDECRKSSKSKVFSMRSTSMLLHSMKDEAEVFLALKGREKSGHTYQTPDFRIHGSFKKRNCRISDRHGEVVAKMARKWVNGTTLLGNDVFSLTIKSGFQTDIIMAFVVILDRISRQPFAPVLCS